MDTIILNKEAITNLISDLQVVNEIYFLRFNVNYRKFKLRNNYVEF
jgi:hypothetical protein